MTWHGAPVHGGRTHALLAALAEAHGRPVGEHALVAEVWGEDTPPANPAKALQVVVSRTRTQTSPLVVERAGGGYRLGLDATGVDATALRHDVAAAAAAEGRGDRVAARDHARRALAGSAPASGGEGPLAALRDDARRLRAEAAAVLGRSLSALGDHREALPLLEEAGVGDEETAAALLRSLAVVHGGPAALDRYAQVRRDLADRLGVDPGPTLTAVHAELLAADNPVRAGLRHESTSLVGREDDIRALRAAVRESRVVSILGPGGLGKTRLAHLLGQEAEQPVVHFVELVGVASPDDVVSEVGSALGRPRLGERPAGAHPGAAQRRPGADRTVAGRGTGAAHPRQLRARGRGGRRPGGLPRGVLPPPARGHHHPGPARRSPPSGSSRSPSSTTTRHPCCSASAPGPRGPRWPSTRRPC